MPKYQCLLLFFTITNDTNTIISSYIGLLQHINILSPETVSISDTVSMGYSLFNNASNQICIEFIANYVTQLYTKATNKGWLDSHPKSTFLDMVTSSAIAFVGTLIKNNELVWKCPRGEKNIKPLFTSDGKRKHEFSGCGFNEEGMAFFNKCNKVWHKTIVKDKTQLSHDFGKFVETTPQEYGFLIQTLNVHTHEDNRKKVHSIFVPTICFDGEDVDEEVAEDTHPMPSLLGDLSRLWG